MKKLSRFVSTAAVLLPVSLYLALAACGGRDHEPREITIYYSNDVHGEIEPCGCAGKPIGGLSRRTTVIEEAAASGLAVFRADSGSFFFEKDRLDSRDAAQFKLKARFLREAYDTLGWNVLNIGPKDLAAGRDFLDTLRDEAAFPFVSTNLIDIETGKPAYEPYSIFEVNGIRIGVIGLFPENHAALRLKSQGLRAAPVIPKAREMAEKLRGKTDLLIALTQLTSEGDKRLAKKVPQLHVIIGGRGPLGLQSPYRIGNTIILQAPNRGRSLGELELVWRGRDVDLFSTVREELLATRKKTILRDIDTVKDDPVRYEKRMREVAEIDSFIEEGKRLNRYSNRLIPLEESISSNPQVQRLLNAYKAEVARMHRAAKGGTGPQNGGTPTGGLRYVGDASCVECHEEIHDFWSETRHGDAFESLIEDDSELDLECIGCHATGFRQEGGFEEPARVGMLKNVQCEVCHGRGSVHVEDDSESMPEKISESKCISCHDEVRDPDFGFEQDNALIRCSQALDRHRESL